MILSDPLANIIFWSLLSLVAVLALIPLAARLAARAGFVDAPGGRKDHAGHVPPIGGLVIFPVFIALAALSPSGGAPFLPYAVALCVIVVAGALDDRFSIAPRWKFLAQFAAAFIIVLWGGARVASLGDLFGLGAVWLGWGHIPFSVIATVLLINAINLIDGLDGLAGGKSLVALFWFAVAAFIAGPAAGSVLLLLGILMGALTGFLFYNARHKFRHKASVFLGDSGSMALGLSLAWFSMTLARTEPPVIWPIAVAWVLALPIVDTCAQFARRVAQGRHPFSADRNHFHHHFVNAGVPVGTTTVILAGIGIATGAIGVVGMVAGVPEPVLAYAWIALLFAHIFISLRPTRLRRLAARFIKPSDGGAA